MKIKFSAEHCYIGIYHYPIRGKTATEEFCIRVWCLCLIPCVLISWDTYPDK